MASTTTKRPRGDGPRAFRDQPDCIERISTAVTYRYSPAGREDLLQEILFALGRALPRFRGQSSEKTFVFRVAHNRALTHRVRGRAPMVAIDAAGQVVDSRPTPEAEASAAQSVERLMRALQALPMASRQILTLGLDHPAHVRPPGHLRRRHRRVVLGTKRKVARDLALVEEYGREL